MSLTHKFHEKIEKPEVYPAADSVYMLDEDGFFFQAKGATENICGYSPFELLGTSFVQIIPLSEIPAIRHYFNRVLKQGETIVFTSKVIHKTHGKVDVLAKVSPLKKEGKVIGIHSMVNRIRANRSGKKTAI